MLTHEQHIRFVAAAMIGGTLGVLLLLYSVFLKPILDERVYIATLDEALLVATPVQSSGGEDLAKLSDVERALAQTEIELTDQEHIDALQLRDHLLDIRSPYHAVLDDTPRLDVEAEYAFVDVEYDPDSRVSVWVAIPEALLHWHEMVFFSYQEQSFVAVFDPVTQTYTALALDDTDWDPTTLRVSSFRAANTQLLIDYDTHTLVSSRTGIAYDDQSAQSSVQRSLLIGKRGTTALPDWISIETISFPQDPKVDYSFLRAEQEAEEPLKTSQEVVQTDDDQVQTYRIPTGTSVLVGTLQSETSLVLIQEDKKFSGDDTLDIEQYGPFVYVSEAGTPIPLMSTTEAHVAELDEQSRLLIGFEEYLQ
jgi:hypothetical protein